MLQPSECKAHAFPMNYSPSLSLMIVGQKAPMCIICLVILSQYQLGSLQSGFLSPNRYGGGGGYCVKSHLLIYDTVSWMLYKTGTLHGARSGYKYNDHNHSIIVPWLSLHSALLSHHHHLQLKGIHYILKLISKHLAQWITFLVIITQNNSLSLMDKWSCSSLENISFIYTHTHLFSYISRFIAAKRNSW